MSSNLVWLCGVVGGGNNFYIFQGERNGNCTATQECFVWFDATAG